MLKENINYKDSANGIWLHKCFLEVGIIKHKLIYGQLAVLWRKLF